MNCRRKAETDKTDRKSSMWVGGALLVGCVTIEVIGGINCRCDGWGHPCQRGSHRISQDCSRLGPKIRRCLACRNSMFRAQDLSNESGGGEEELWELSAKKKNMFVKWSATTSRITCCGILIVVLSFTPWTGWVVGSGGQMSLKLLSEKALGVELIARWSSKFTPGVTYYINSCQFVSSFSKSASWVLIDHPDNH